MIYLDHNAITPMRPEALAAVERALRVFGNPSSVHAAGREARDLLDVSREKVAAALHARPSEIVFTSGATESAATAIRGVLARTQGKRRGLVVTAVEHPCVADRTKEYAGAGGPVTVLGVDREGRLDLDAARAAITGETALVCAMLANNETGVLFPVRELALWARERGALFFCDAVQAVGKLPVDLSELPVDLLALTGQKFGGPRGAGALFVRSGVQLQPLLAGGQERGRRAGTENLPGVAGLAAGLEAAAAAQPREEPRIRALRDALEQGLVRAWPGASVNGARPPRLPNTCSVTLPGVDAEALLMALDLEGLCASAGSACHAGDVKPSGVLTAMGLTAAEARSTLRLSLGWPSTEADVQGALELIPRHAGRVKAAIAS